MASLDTSGSFTHKTISDIRLVLKSDGKTYALNFDCNSNVCYGAAVDLTPGECITLAKLLAKVPGEAPPVTRICPDIQKHGIINP